MCGNYGIQRANRLATALQIGVQITVGEFCYDNTGYRL